MLEFPFCLSIHRTFLFCFFLVILFPCFAYLFLIMFIFSDLLRFHLYSKHPFYVLSYYRYACLERWCSSDIFQFRLFYLYCVIAMQLSFLLTTFSSTTKRSLQPHDDKLLIGGQQLLTSVCISCLCFLLLLISRTFLLVLQFSFLDSCYSYSTLVE